MRVAMYFTPLWGVTRTPSGVGKHILHMADALRHSPTVSRLSLLAGSRAYREQKEQLPPSMAELPVSLLPGSETLMRRVQLASDWFPLDRWAGDVDWIYCPKEQPVSTRKARLAVTVHDLLAFEPSLPGMPRVAASPKAAARWRLSMSRIIARADLIAAVSNFTAQRLMRMFDVKEQRIVVVGNGVDRRFFRERGSDDTLVTQRYGVAADRYLIAVGGLTYRKGGDTLLELAERFAARGTDLPILLCGVGHDDDLISRLDELKKSVPRLRFSLAGYVPDAHLAVLYSNALALVFPSRYEGFGIPVLEAMAAGTVPICSDSSSLPEVLGNAGYSVPGADVNQVVELIERLAHEPTLWAERRHAGRQRAAEFTWERCARQLTNAMQSVAEAQRV